MIKAARIGLVTALAVAAGCGRSPEQERADALQRSANEIKKSADQMQSSAQDLARSTETAARHMAAAALSGTTADGAPIEPVDYRVLQEALPDVPGWRRGKPTGERMTMPVRYTHVTARYAKGDVKIEAKITDSAKNRVLVSPMGAMLTAGYAKENAGGYEKATRIAGYPGFEKWSASGNGELNVLVSDRFIVELEGRELASVKDLYAFLDHVDLKKIAGQAETAAAQR
jgi:hypothetical protein